MREVEMSSGRGFETRQLHQKHIGLPKGLWTAVGRIHTTMKLGATGWYRNQENGIECSVFLMGLNWSRQGEK